MSEEVQTTEQPVVEQTTEQPVSWVSEDGTLNREAFGELGQHSMFDKLTKIDDLAKAYINVEKVKSKKVEELLSSDDESIRSELSKMRGIPESADEYEFSVEIPESLGIGSDRITEIKSKFKEIGIPKEAADKLMEWEVSTISSKMQAMEEERESLLNSTYKELKSKWKNNIDNNIEKAANALDYLDLKEFADDVRNPQTHLALKFAEAIYDRIIPLIENDTIIEARQSQSISTTKDRMDDIRNKMFELNSSGKHNSPEYSKLVKEMGELVSKIS